jgi:hypothetical protein
MLLRATTHKERFVISRPPRLVFSAILIGGAVAANCGRSSGAAPTRQVNISALATELSEDGATTTDVPLALASPSIELDDRSTRSVTSVSPGKWTAQVPSGGYWVITGTDRYRATGDALDLGYLTSTRAQAAPPTAPTPATLSISGLVSWTPGRDRIQLFSWGANSWDVFDPQLQSGLTAATVREDWNSPAFGYGALKLLTAADRLHAIQYRNDHDASMGVDYQHAVAATSATGISMNSGQAVSATLPAMVAPSQTATLSVDWRTSQFEAAIPPAFPLGHELSIFAEVMQPGGEIPLASSPNLLDFFPALNASNKTPDMTVSLGYSRFLPAQYTEVLYSGWLGQISRVAGSTANSTIVTTFVVRRDAMSAAPSPLVPLVSSVRAVQIGGKDAGAQQTGVGLTPLVSWTPPAVGTPSRYLLKLYSIASGGGGAQLVSTLSVPGSATSVQVPARLQQSGNWYFIVISAQAGIGTDSAPLRAHLPTGAATYATESYSP